MNNLIEAAKQSATKHDWPDDFGLENGMYSNKCHICGEGFIGYKRRVTCRKCHMENFNVERNQS